MAEKTGLDVSLFTLGTPAAERSYLGTLKSLTIEAENDLVDARGLADAFEFNQVVKQAQRLRFTVMLDRGDGGDVGRRMTNLDVTVWTLDGPDYVSQIQSGEIKIVTPVKDRSALKNLEKVPVPVGGIQVTLYSDMVVIDSAALTQQLLTSAISGFKVSVGITYGGSSVALPMIFKSAQHKLDRDELQLESAVLEIRGTPSVSGANTILGEVLGGTTSFAFELETGAGHYGTSAADESHAAQVGVLTQLEVAFKAGHVVEMTGTLEIQSQMLVS